MADQEKPRIDSIQQHIADIAKAHPQIAGRVEGILGSLSNILFNLQAENADPAKVERQLSAAELFLEGVQTEASLNTDISAQEPGAKLAASVSESIKARVGRASGLPDWMKK